MKHRTRMITVLSALSLVAPISAQAATEQETIDSCAAAVAAEIGEVQGSPVGYRSDKGSGYSPGRLRSQSTIYMDVTNSRNREIVARADCVVSADGEIVELKMLYLNALSAHHRSSGG